MPGRSSVEAIHLIRSLIEKYRKRQRDLHMFFLDLEKAYDNVPRELIWITLVDKGSSRRYIKVIRDMYDGAKTHVRTFIRNMEFFPVDVGLHQGSVISPYIFAFILDELSKEIQEDIPWCLIFADDIMLVSESAKEKTEYLRCDFGNGELAHNEEVDVCIEDKILQPKESFRYLGSMLHKFGRIDEDVSNRIKAAWMKWRAATGVLCDRNVEVAELRMLRWTCGKTLLDMIPNGVYRAQLEVETIINKMREGRMRWFGHVRRRPQSSPVRRVEALVVDGLRRRVLSDVLLCVLACPFPALPAPCSYGCFMPFVLCVVALLYVSCFSRPLLVSMLVCFRVLSVWLACMLLFLASRLCRMVVFRVCRLVLALPAPVLVCLLCAFVVCVVAFA
ncbi:retrovirus-related pol polyprotein LINE-1 [Tanacetum coccineum]